jgi:hypothetical protein
VITRFFHSSIYDFDLGQLWFLVFLDSFSFSVSDPIILGLFTAQIVAQVLFSYVGFIVTNGFNNHTLLHEVLWDTQEKINCKATVFAGPDHLFQGAVGSQAYIFLQSNYLHHLSNWQTLAKSLFKWRLFSHF